MISRETNRKGRSKWWSLPIALRLTVRGNAARPNMSRTLTRPKSEPWAFEPSVKRLIRIERARFGCAGRNESWPFQPSLYIRRRMLGKRRSSPTAPLRRRRLSSASCARFSSRGISAVLNMKVIAAYLLAVLGGNTSPTADDVKNILESVGAEADEEKLDFLLAELKDKDITEVIASGREKFASVPSGGGAMAVGAPAAAAGGAAPAEEAKKEEKVEEKEESDDDMGFSLFD